MEGQEGGEQLPVQKDTLEYKISDEQFAILTANIGVITESLYQIRTELQGGTAIIQMDLFLGSLPNQKPYAPITELDTESRQRLIQYFQSLLGVHGQPPTDRYTIDEIREAPEYSLVLTPRKEVPQNLGVEQKVNDIIAAGLPEIIDAEIAMGSTSGLGIFSSINQVFDAQGLRIIVMLSAKGDGVKVSATRAQQIGAPILFANMSERIKNSILSWLVTNKADISNRAGMSLVYTPIIVEKKLVEIEIRYGSETDGHESIEAVEAASEGEGSYEFVSNVELEFTFGFKCAECDQSVNPVKAVYKGMDPLLNAKNMAKMIKKPKGNKPASVDLDMDIPHCVMSRPDNPKIDGHYSGVTMTYRIEAPTVDELIKKIEAIRKK